MPQPPKPSAAAQRITAWSFSRLNDYTKCPAFAKFKHVMRLKEPGNAAMDRGAQIHKLAENYTTAKRAGRLPAELATFAEEFKALRKQKVIVEQDWAFTSKWEQTGWFDRDAWCRCKVDCCYLDLKRNVLVVIDYKTGKINEGHLDQLSLYALAGLVVFPTAVSVEVQLWYVDHGVLLPETEKSYPRSDLPKLKKEWEKKVQPMLLDGRFPPKPGKACQWCHFSKAKNGPCEF